MKKSEQSKNVDKLIKMLSKFFKDLDEEFSHGCYKAPDFVPAEFSNERNYYKNHNKIIMKVVKDRTDIDNLIEKLKNSDE